MKKAAALLTLFIFIPALLFAAGTVTLTSDDTEQYPNSVIRTLKWTISSTSGSSTMTGGTATGVAGTIKSVKAEPNTTNKPDDNYDIEGLDAVNSMDMFQNDLWNMPQSATVNGNMRVPLTADVGDRITLYGQDIQLSVTNFNASGTATSVLYMYVVLP